MSPLLSISESRRALQKHPTVLAVEMVRLPSATITLQMLGDETSMHSSRHGLTVLPGLDTRACPIALAQKMRVRPVASHTEFRLSR